MAPAGGAPGASRREIGEVTALNVLTKRSKEQFVVNHLQIESIESIPEVKITMMNHDFFLVRETVEEIIQKIAEYNAKVQDIHREITVTDRR